MYALWVAYFDVWIFVAGYVVCWFTKDKAKTFALSLWDKIKAKF